MSEQGNTGQEPQRSPDSTDILKLMILSQRETSEANILLQRRDMMWRNIRALALAAAFIIGPIIYIWGVRDLLSPDSFDDGYAAMVRVDGEISSSGSASARKIVKALDAAFKDEDAAAVVLLINSPGGSPVQSSIIHDHVLRLRDEYPDKRVIAVGEDYVTSGAYWIATAAEEIWVNRSTMTGSIGVVLATFGLQDIAHAMLIERRVITAGKDKVINDMYLPLQQENRERIEGLLACYRRRDYVAKQPV